MSQVVNSVDSHHHHGHTKEKNEVSRYATIEEEGVIDSEVSRYATYTESELVERLGDITVITYAKNGNPDIIEAPVEMLGYSQEAREIADWHVDELIASDESTWDALKVCFWPDYMDKPSPEIKSRIIGGNHRTKSARAKNPPLETLRMRVGKVVDEVDFLRAQVEDNASHGLNYTEDQRKAHAFKFREMGVSVRKIAKDLKIKEKTLYNWFSDRDTNKSKKREKTREQAEGVLANLGIKELSEEWQVVPDVSADVRQLARVGQTINDFLAETPTAENKSYIVAWIQSLSKESRCSIADDMCETIQWLTNITTLLRSEKIGGDSGY
jgi:hypothetical protein